MEARTRTDRKARGCLVSCLGILLVGVSPAPADDCNGNGIDDAVEAASGGLVGYYYGPDNTAWEAPYNFARIDATVDFPNPFIPGGTVGTDFFSVRWVGSLVSTATGGAYTLIVEHDDGFRLYLDGVLLMGDHGSDTHSTTVTLEASTEYHIRLEYFENWGEQKCILRWIPPGGSEVLIPTENLRAIYDSNLNGVPDECEFGDCNNNLVPDSLDLASGLSADCDDNGVLDECQPEDDCDQNGVLDWCELNDYGLLGAYYTASGAATYGPHLFLPENHLGTRIDAPDYAPYGDVFYFPYDGVPFWQQPYQMTDTLNPNITVRWTGYLIADYSETYTFYLTGNDRAKLWVEDVLIGDIWTSACCWHSACIPIDLEAGVAYRIVLEFADASYMGYIGLEWSSASVPQEWVPNAALSPMVDLDGNGIPDVCDVDCNNNGVSDDIDIANGTSEDCDDNGVPDECDILTEDCNGNGVPDECDVPPLGTYSPDCNGDLIPDECQLAGNDCNGNGVPDECDLPPLGTYSLDCNEDLIPDECQLAGNDCNSNGIPDECDLGGPPVPQYGLDDGSSENEVGLGNGGTLAWLNHFVVVPNGESIKAVRVAYGNVATGTPATVYLWDDPDGNGNPNDAQVLAAASTTVQNPGTDTFIYVDITETYVGPEGTSFFVGVLLQHAAGEIPAPIDQTSDQGESWLAGGSGGVNPNNLSAASLFGQPADFGFTGNWLVRPVSAADPPQNDCNGNGVPDECDDCNSNGVPDVDDIALGTSEDCNANCVPDECDVLPPPWDYGQAHWRFEEATGTTVLDSGPNGLDGTLNALPFRTTGVAVDPVPQSGFANIQSLDLNWQSTSSGGFFTAADTGGALTMGDQDFTIEAWVKLDYLSNTSGNNERQYLCQKKPLPSQDDQIDYAFLVQRGNNGPSPNYGKAGGFSGRELQLYFGTGSSTWSITSNLEIADFDWHFVSVAYDTITNVVRFGIDDTFETLSFSDNPRTTNGGSLRVGSHQNGQGTDNFFFRGMIDEMRISRRVVPIAELLNAAPVPTGDCQSDGIPDECQLEGNDCNANGLPDECELAGNDCNANGVLDSCDIALGTSTDCDGNGVPDECELDGNDCNANGVFDACDILNGTSTDCNGNGIPDECDIAAGTSEDCQPDGLPDECQLASFVYAWDDGEADISVITDGNYMAWLSQFTVLNDLGTITDVDITFGSTAVGQPVTLYLWSDPDGDGDPTDATVLASWSLTVEPGMDDPVEFSRIDIPDTYVGPNGTSFFVGAVLDVPVNDTKSLRDSIYPAAANWDEPTTPGRSWLVGTSAPVNPNDLTAGAVEFGLFEDLLPPGNWCIRAVPQNSGGDCNGNGIPDECDIADGTSLDCNGTGRPDECEEIANGDFDASGVVDMGDFSALTLALSGPDVAPDVPVYECLSAYLAAFDFDEDEDMDMHDFSRFQQVFSGP